MQLEDAVAILNREKHRGHDRWLAGFDGQWAIDILADAIFVLNAFEAIAVAREYERIARERPDPVLCRPLD